MALSSPDCTSKPHTRRGPYGDLEFQCSFDCGAYIHWWGNTQRDPDGIPHMCGPTLEELMERDWQQRRAASRGRRTPVRTPAQRTERAPAVPPAPRRPKIVQVA